MKTAILISCLSLMCFIVGAQSWVQQSISTTQNLNDVFFLNEDFGWIVGDSGTVFQYSNGDWAQIYTGFTTNINAGFLLDSNDIWLACDDGQIYHFCSGSFNLYSAPANVDLRDICMIDSTTGWVIGNSGLIAKYENYQWTDYSMSGVDYDLWQLDFYNDTIGYIVGLHYTLLKYDSIWVDLAPGSGTVEISAVHMISPDQYFLGTFQAFPGAHWHRLQQYPGGTSFYYNDQTASAIRSIEIGDSLGWAVGHSGEILKYDQTDFTGFYTCSQALNALDLITDTCGWIVGNAGVLFKYTHTTYVEEDSLSNYTDQLFKMYPNPFDDQLVIQTSDYDVEIEVYDIKGNLIEEFDYLSPAENKINLNLDYLKRGVYMIRVKTNTLDKVKRFVKM